MNKISLNFTAWIMLLTGFLLFPLSNLKAQSYDKELLKGIKLVHTERYRKALPILENVVTKEPKNAEALYYTGVCNLQLSHNQKGMEYLEKGLSIDPDIDKEHQLYWLGVAYHYNYKFDDAITKFSELKKSLPKDDVRIDYLDKTLKELEYAKAHQKLRPEFYVENLEGGVNTSHSEHSPLISQDGKTLYYTSRQDKPIGKKEGIDGDYMEDIMKSSIDNNFRWSDASLLSSNVINANRHEASVQLFENDTKMIVYKHKRNGDLYVTEKTKDAWGEPAPFDKGQINTKYYESHGFLMPDGKTIFFASSRNGNLDIFKSTKDDDGKWTEAIMLGPEINTDHDEDAPFITEDGKTMYFSSNGHNSIGGFDIFVSKFDETTGKWGRAKHLSAPVNTPQDDMYLVMDKTNSYGFFASNRAGGKGEKDIYKVGRTYPLNVKGLIASETSKTPVKGVKLSFFDDKYNEKVACDNNDTGNYGTELNCNSTYKVSFYSNDYKEGKEAFHQDEITLPVSKSSGKSFDKDFLLPESAIAKLLKSYTLDGVVTNVADGSVMNGVVQVKNNKTNKILESTTTEGKYNLQFKATQGDDYTINFIESDGISYPNVENFKADSELALNKDLNLDRAATILAARHLEVNNTNTDDNNTRTDNANNSRTAPKSMFKIVYFDFNKSKLTSAAKKVLDEVAGSSDQGITKIILTGHADNIGSNSYNNRLSKKRANSVLKYLSKKGLSKRKMTVDFKGEDAPVASNDTDSGRSQNRRVEIKVN